MVFNLMIVPSPKVMDGDQKAHRHGYWNENQRITRAFSALDARLE